MSHLDRRLDFMDSPQCAGNDRDFKYCKCFATWVVDAAVMEGGVGFQGALGRVAVLSVLPGQVSKDSIPKTERGKRAQCWIIDRWTACQRIPKQVKG